MVARRKPRGHRFYFRLQVRPDARQHVEKFLEFLADWAQQPITHTGPDWHDDSWRRAAGKVRQNKRRIGGELVNYVASEFA